MIKTDRKFDFKSFVNAQDEISTERIIYCYQIGSTFVCLSSMEQNLIHAITMCDKIKLKNKDPNMSMARLLLSKREHTLNSTMGNIIRLLQHNGISEKNLNYLRWLKRKRDFFIHRFFEKCPWPGELNAKQIEIQCRRLRYLEKIFLRGSERLWKILVEEKFLYCEDLGENGSLLFNPEFLNIFGREVTEKNSDTF